MNKEAVAKELVLIAKDLAAVEKEAGGAILRLDAWKDGKPEISVHNRWFIVEKEGVDLGKLTHVRELDGWVVTEIDSVREYITVTSPDGEEHDFAQGFKLNIGSDTLGREAGRITTPRYVISVNDYQVFGGSHQTAGQWKSMYGRPSPQNIKRYVEKYNESLEPSGVNSHVGRRGAIYGAAIVDQETGEVVAQWEDKGIVQKYKSAPMFEVVSSEEEKKEGDPEEVDVLNAKEASIAAKVAAKVVVSSAGIGARFPLTRDLHTKGGTEFKSGEEVQIKEYTKDAPFKVKVEAEGGRRVNLPVGAAYKVLRGFPKPPSVSTMERWSNDGVAMSVDGHRVEPDGFSSSGAPSWILALGFI